MKNCAMCSEELKFGNTPVFGSGKLNDGNIVCMKCSNKIMKINSSLALKLKNYSLDDINNLLKESENTPHIKDSAAELNNIIQQINDLNYSDLTIKYLLNKKETKSLHKILAPEECIDNMVEGWYNDSTGILVSTNRRLLFVDKGLIYGLKVEDFPLDKISSIQYETGLMFGKIKIYTSGNMAEIKNVNKSYTRLFAEFVRDKLSKTNIAEINSPQPSMLDQLEKLAKLRDNGIITIEEFGEQKKKILDRL